MKDFHKRNERVNQFNRQKAETETSSPRTKIKCKADVENQKFVNRTYEGLFFVGEVSEAKPNRPSPRLGALVEF